ncbi:phosphoglycerate dehydrogenase [Rhodospira trueperi]|uniref:D-3-phosphoglycerate dehydrogenase n=1 Tax=Rhodospira trueperi TaxID=69960 RepID=A0A1G6XWP9_9PROT|nr:phosphoglycerate dehydrogenase [Rhodospira trueperi]SDD82540.1 D-3-phosphoglycerate dehydrogenase [Rhodospira trueperi]
MSKLSLPKDRIKILLLENVHSNAVEYLDRQGYANVTHLSTALSGDALKDALADTHILGIRSRTRVTVDALAAAEKLIAIGCFSIGTDQVDLQAAKIQGIPVFNAPYSNTRSVAELVLGEIICLFRGTFAKAWAAHDGGWEKTAEGSHEVRGKTLGIVGYGHIGSQLSVLAEALGMHVVYYDIVEKLAIGNAAALPSLDAVLETADVVSLHVPSSPLTKDMIGARELGLMKPGSFLVNAARGNVVDIDALANALRTDHLAGAAVDVFPKEPKGGNDVFESPLRGLRNVILTPHVGGSTMEAQANIGTEVAEKLVKYSDNGSTTGAVNFVEVSLPSQENVSRFMHIHKNVPGVLSAINDIFSSRRINIAGEYLRTDSDIGYVVVDVDQEIEAGMGIRKALAAIPGTVRTRFLL